MAAPLYRRPSNRTVRERAANEIDRDLYRLMEWAERELRNGTAIRMQLAQARAAIRAQMHPRDRRETM